MCFLMYVLIVPDAFLTIFLTLFQKFDLFSITALAFVLTQLWFLIWHIFSLLNFRVSFKLWSLLKVYALHQKLAPYPPCTHIRLLIKTFPTVPRNKLNVSNGSCISLSYAHIIYYCILLHYFLLSRVFLSHTGRNNSAMMRMIVMIAASTCNSICGRAECEMRTLTRSSSFNWSARAAASLLLHQGGMCLMIYPPVCSWHTLIDMTMECSDYARRPLFNYMQQIVMRVPARQV